MPKHHIDYTKTVIYKICSKDIKIVDCYVGSTNDFDRRKRHHKSRCHNENAKDHNMPIYQFIRSHGGCFNWSMILVELYKTCTNKLEKLQRERYYVEQLNATLNGQIPGINLELGQKDYQAKYRANNEEAIKKRANKKCCCKCGGQYTYASKTMHFRTQLHVNYIKRQQLLANHEKLINKLDQIIEITEKFIKRSERFLAGGVNI
jgi:hypothetical protein